MRIDILSRLKMESGLMVVIPIENLQKILQKETQKKYDDFKIMKTIVDNNGDVISLEPYQEVSVGKIFTIDKDGGNSTILRVAPVINNCIRVLEIGEKTAEEYCMMKKDEAVNLENMAQFFVEQLENYKKEMLESEN